MFTAGADNAEEDAYAAADDADVDADAAAAAAVFDTDAAAVVESASAVVADSVATAAKTAGAGLDDDVTAAVTATSLISHAAGSCNASDICGRAPFGRRAVSMRKLAIERWGF